MHQLPTSTPFLDAMIVGPVGWIAFNRPSRRNAITGEMWSALAATVKLLDERPDVRVICIRGAGHEAFASGADISEFAEERNNAAAARAYEKLNADAFAAIRTAGKPVIAMIEGYCIGGGLAVALACDVRVAGHGAVFALPPARLGLAYPLDGLRDLLTAVGLSAAKELLFTARRIGPHEALRIGLVDRISEHPEHEVGTLCAEIVDCAPLSILHGKRALDALAGRTGHVDAATVDALAARCFDSADYAEGRAAFAEKRKPKFNGR